jgi:hypothetical protein
MPHCRTTVQTDKISIEKQNKCQARQSPPTKRLYRLLKVLDTKRTLIAIYLRTCDLNSEIKINEIKREYKHK